jgi:hypothetical protein
MTTTAGDCIEGARDQHTSFDERRHPDRMLLRQLSGYHRRLCAKAVHVNESIMATALTIPLPLTSFAGGYTLPAYQYLHGGEMLGANGIAAASFTLVPWAARNDGGRMPAGYVHGGVLYLLGADTDWTSYANLRLTYTPMAPEFTALADVLLLPDTAADTCGAFLALTMANRGVVEKGAPKPDVDLFLRLYTGAEEDFLTDVFLQRGNQSNRIREVRSFS